MNVRQRRLGRGRPETVEEWLKPDKVGHYVTRGELMWFLNLADEARALRAHDTRWYRRLSRAVLRRFRGRVETGT